MYAGREAGGGAVALAVNKRKILESARKLAQKGSKEKALAEYQKLLKLDPKDAKLRLEIGDAHRRWGQVDQAVETYTRVADQYMAEGFDARAVAVFKQIVNLDPDRFDAYGPLAELYERMGLTAEAIGALQTAADGFHRQGKKDEALDLLRKMANVDPSNTTSRIKVADLLHQQEKNGDAIAEYLLAVAELERQGDDETVGTVYRRILEVDETHVGALGGLAENLAARGKVSEAVPLAERAAQLDDANPDRYELLADLFEKTNRPADREKALRGMAEVYRQRGDDDRARSILQRFVPSELEVAGDPAVGGADLANDGDFFDAELSVEDGPELSADFGNDLGIDPGSSLSGDTSSTTFGDTMPPAEEEGEEEELLLEDVAFEPPAAADVAEKATPAPTREPVAPPGDFDAEQLLAEATVYLRYGKREKAVAHLERIVEAEPGHRVALEKLGEAFAEDGMHERAVEVWLRAARAALAAEDTDALRVLRGRIAVLDESAVADIPSIGDAAAEGEESAPTPTTAPSLEQDASVEELEFDAGDEDLMLDDDEFLDDVAASEVMNAAPGELAVDADLGEELEEHDIEVDTDLDYDDLVATDDESDVAAEAGRGEEPSASASAPQPQVIESESDESLSADARQQVLDDLEEADFYMQQGLHDEASAIYQRVLAIAPNHPRAMLHLGEIADARGAAPAAADVDAAPAPDTGLDDGDPLSLVGAEEEAPTATEPEIASEADAADDMLSIDVPDEELLPDASDEGLAELDLGDVGEDVVAASDDADAGATSSESDDTGVEEADGGSGDGSTQELRPGAASAPEAEAPAPGVDVSPPILGAEGDFDLAAALSDAFDDDPGSSQTGIAANTADGFESVFDAFKKGVSETLTEGDHQAHYDLAIAYKEMGLLEDAINELRTAMADPGRTAECLHLIGLCAIDADQAPLAIEHLEQLLMVPDLDPKAAMAGRFDLGRAYEAIADLDGARREWEQVIAIDPDFQDVTARLNGLGAAKPDDQDDAGDGFESFDDVMEGLEEIADDDAVVEAEAIVEGEPVAADDVGLEEPAEPEDEAPPAERPRTKPKPAAKRKKKKISFL